MYEPARVRGAVVEEVHVDRKTGEIIPPFEPCNKGCKRVKGGFTPCKPCNNKHFNDIRRGEFKIRLSYRDHFVNMWRVTWDYIARNADRRRPPKRRKKGG